MKGTDMHPGERRDDAVTADRQDPLAEPDHVVLMTEEEFAQLLGVEELPDVEMRNPRC